MLQLRDINIHFTEPVIEDGSLSIPAGTMTALTGPSGSGKTTLLYCVGLISSCKEYEYLFNGKNIDLSSEEEKGIFRKTKIGYIFQENNLNRNLTVLENIRLSASLAGADTEPSRLRSLLKQVGIEGREAAYPATLSGGEQQRAAIACALAKDPELILADEPTSSLDGDNTEQVLKLFEGIAAEGKMVVIATHSPAVVERCGLVYEIKEKKPVLIKGQDPIKDDAVEEETKKRFKLKAPFFLRYQYKSSHKGQLLKNLTVVICALAASFTALSTGYIKDFEKQQREYYKSVSERELAIVKQVDPNRPSGKYDDTLPSISTETITKLQQLEHIVEFGPVVRFYNRSGHTREDLSRDYTKPLKLKPGSLNPRISYKNKNGKSGSLEFCNWSIVNAETGEELYDPGDNYINGAYFVDSYFTYENMDLKCTAIDQTVEPGKGIYLPTNIIDSFGLLEEDLNYLEFTIDVDVPVERHIGIATILSSDSDSYEIPCATDLYVKEQIILPVRGFLQEDAFPPSFGAVIHAPNSIMMEYIQKHLPSESLFQLYKEKMPDVIKPNDKFYDWRPWAYYLLVDDVSNIDTVKKAVAEISPDLDIIHEYQNYEAVMESVDNSQKVVLYISLAILAVILCLSAIVYVNIIDKRKYEFAMLRANGLTKREIRRLVMTEMGVQTIWTFVVSLLLGWIVFEILSKTIGGFRFDLLTVLWLAVLAVCSVLLPSVVSLTLTNRYEPDMIMRN